MKETVLEIIYSSLISFVPSTIAILVSLAGAFWIFKVREKTVAEGKIFELGREIANILQSKEVRGPIDGFAYTYIDNACQHAKEKNREKVLRELLRKYLHYYVFDEAGKDKDKFDRDAANIVVAVATERVQSLVPQNINWSGKGSFYSPFGVDIETKDNFFPFGTKLYRQWVEKFGDIYNDLWAITTSREFFVDYFLKGYENTSIGIDRKFVDRWLDEIDSRIKAIHPIHAKLLTQIQIVDTQIDLPRLAKDIRMLFLYGILLSVSGYIVPKFIYQSDMYSLAGVLCLTLAAAFSYLLIGLRVVSAVKPVVDKDLLRKIYVPKLIKELEGMAAHCMRYKTSNINNILSLDSDLKLKSTVKKKLENLVDKIETFNEYASILFKRFEEIFEPVKAEFITEGVNQGGFGVHVLDLPNEKFDLEGSKARIMKENCNFTLSFEEVSSSRTIYTINLLELNSERRLKLCEKLDYLKSAIRSLPIYKTAIVSLAELQDARENAILQVNKML